MSILVLTPTAEAAKRLSSALARRGQEHSWATEYPEQGELPLVAVIDSELSDHEEILRRLQEHAPWCRCVLMNAGDSPAKRPNTRIVNKPFDAAALAEQLVQEAELARLSKREQSLLSRARDLTALVQSSFEAIVGLDREERVILWNPGAETLYGFTADEMLGRLISVLDRGASPSPSLSDGEKQVLQRRRRHRNGGELTVLVSRTRVGRSAFGSALAYTEVSLDISAKVQLEKELEHSLRLAHLGRLAATMSHELNNPLAVVLSCADWFTTRCGDSLSEECREVARDLELASRRISSYVNQMTGFVRRNADSTSSSSFSDTLACALRLVRPRAAVSAVRVAIHGEGLADIAVRHDSARLTHALVNLLSNAIDAAKHGGRTVDITIQQGKRELSVIVEDDGPGIDPSIASHLFEPFSTTKPYGEGTGLGLALTREVLREHGGAVTLENRRPHGAVAIMSLPVEGPEPSDREAGS